MTKARTLADNFAADINGITAGTGITGGGTSGTVTVTNEMATAIDAKGDLVGGTGADTFARLEVGANGTVLTADSVETTGLKWVTPVSGGMTSIASGSLSGGSLALTTISASYKNLHLVLRDVSPSSSGATLSWTANAITSYTIFQAATASTTGTGVQHYTTVNGTTAPLLYDGITTGDNTLIINIYDYANTTSIKVFDTLSKYASSNGANQTTRTNGGINDTAAIDEITVSFNTGTFSSGTYTLYGVNQYDY
jgi:hypothetical protein